MSNTQDDFMKRFQAMINTLSPEKRSQLYVYLQNMEPAQRNQAMADILNKYESTMAARAAQQPKPQTQVTSAPVQPQAQPVNTAPVQSAHESSPSAPLTRQKPAEQKVQTKVTEKKEDKPRKRKKKVNPAVIILSVLCVILAGTTLFLLILKDNNPFTKKPVEETTTTIEDTTPVTVLDTAIETENAEVTETTIEVTPAPTMVPLQANAPDLTGLTVVIDPGHQQVADTNEETVSPNSSSSKPRCTSGAVGVSTGVTEYELTLEYALIMRDYLTQCGATVILTRTENDVNISNQERSQIAVDNNADIYIRLHADRANTAAESGVRVFVANSGEYSSSLTTWGDRLGSLVATAEGLEFVSTITTDGYTGLNYATSVRSFQLSLGLLSNSDDEAILVTEENRAAVAAAVAEFCADFTL